MAKRRMYRAIAKMLNGDWRAFHFFNDNLEEAAHHVSLLNSDPSMKESHGWDYLLPKAFFMDWGNNLPRDFTIPEVNGKIWIDGISFS